MLFRGMDRATLDAAYNNTAAVGIPKRDQYVGGWAARSDALRKTREAKADLRYGAPRDSASISFPADGRAHPPSRTSTAATGR
jgi:arylformamidase